MSNWPFPPNDPASRPHWDGAKLGKLMLAQCMNCGQYRFPASTFCSTCRHSGFDWICTSGRGTIQSFCRFHRAYWQVFEDRLPYTVIQVKLDEGVQLMSNFASSPAISPSIGMRVSACYETVQEGLTLIKFSPLDISTSAA